MTSGYGSGNFRTYFLILYYWWAGLGSNLGCIPLVATTALGVGSTHRKQDKACKADYTEKKTKALDLPC